MMKQQMLGRIVLLAGLILALAGCQTAATPAALAAGEASELRGGGGGIAPGGTYAEGVVVVGSGSISVEPEVAEVTFGVDLRGDDPAALLDEAATKIDQALTAVAELGVAESDSRTVSYNLWVETMHDPERGMPTGEIVYHLSHHVRVTLRDLDQVGALLAAAVSAGANTIGGVNFTVGDVDALVEQARAAALEDAADRAQQMAEGLGVALGKPVLVTEIGANYPMPMDRGMGGGGAMMEMAAPTISPGSFSVAVSVQVVYAIR